MVRNVKIPKRIGAVKLSKKVRKKARKAIETATNPFVRDFATAAMAAAGRVRRERGRRGEEQGSEREDYHMCGGTRINVDGAKVAEVFRAAALDGLRRFMEGLEEGFRKAEAEAGQKPASEPPRPEQPPEPRAKPKARVKAEVSAGPKARKPKPGKPRPSRRKPGAAPA